MSESKPLFGIFSARHFPAMILLVSAISLLLCGCAGSDPRPAGIDSTQEANTQETALERQALAAMQRGDYETGIRIYLQVLEADPDNGRALYYTGYAHGQLGEIDSEILYYELAADAGYRPVALFVNLGEAYLGRGQPDKAEDTFRRALARNPDTADLHFGLGRSLEVQHEYENAEFHLKKAVQLAPDVIVFREYLGLYYEETGRLEEAGRQFARILEIDPDYEGAQEHLRQIRRRRKALEERGPAVGGE